jgi:ParB family chromosome partitioning protein
MRRENRQGVSGAMAAQAFTGNANVNPGAIDIDSPEFAAQFGGVDEDSQTAPDGDFGPPADFDGGTQVPEIVKDLQRGKKSRNSSDAAAEKAAAKAAAKNDAAAGPDLTGLVPSKAAQKATVQNVPVELLDGIDGGDPVERAFVENVKLHGILTPIRVRATDDGRYNIVYGKRRSQAARANGFATIPAVVEKDASANDYVQGLAENYARSSNVIEEHRMVMALLDHYREQGDTGANDRKAVAAIAKATGMTVAQVKKARDVGRLVPELVLAVEEGAMSSWSALNASRMPVEVQRRLVDVLNDKGKVTPQDVVNERRHRQFDAIEKIADDSESDGQGMFDAPDTGYGAEESATGAADFEMPRSEKVAAAVAQARRALDLLTGLSAKSDEEADAITLLSQVIENLTSA